jgi:integrase
MVYSFARIGAALGMRVEDVYQQNRRLWVRLHEKGGPTSDGSMRPATTTILIGMRRARYGAVLRACSRGACRRRRVQIAREAESRGLTPPGLVSNDWLWFRRVRFIIDALVIRSHPGRCQAETPLIAQLKFAGPAL